MSQSERFSIQEKSGVEDFVETNGIRIILTDLDGTLIDTHKVFETQVGLFLEFCHSFIPEVSFDTLKSQFKLFESESFDVLGVSRQRWKYIIGKLSKVYGVDDFEDGYNFLNDIFYSVPNAFDGVRETLEVFQGLDLRLGLVTHAARTWTTIKMDGNDLWPYFENIEIIDPEVHKYKESRHWKKAANFFDVESNQIMMIGDNLMGDVVAASRLRFGKLVWIPSAFRFFNNCEVPKGTIEVDKIGNLISALSSESITTI